MGKIAAKEGEKRPLPGSYSEMYPNRFIKADMLKGAKVTLTIKEIIGEGLVSPDDDEKKGAKKGPLLEWIVSFKERELQWVMNKTNAFCLYKMFGGDPHSWQERRITLFPTTTMAFGERKDCIRIWGSPDIGEDMQFSVPQGRKKPWEAVMRRTATKAPAIAPATTEGLDPRILTAFGILGWDLTRQAQYVSDNQALGQAGMVKDLNRLIEESDQAA